MKKGIIILGPAGSGKSTLAQSIVAMFNPREVAEIEASDLESWNESNTSNLSVIIVEGATKFTSISRLTDPLFASKLIIVSQLAEKDIPKELTEFYNIFTLK